MAYKVFANGFPLTASELNTYLMNQSVMVFANAAARSAALTSPTEGMTTYLEDTNKIEVWTGAAWSDINDNTAAIPKSTVTTAGDLIIADGNASVTRLGIGSNGQILQSNGTTATWATPAGSSEDWREVQAFASIPTGSSSAVISGLSGRQRYLLVVSGVSSSSNNATFFVRFNSNASGYLSTGLGFNPLGTYNQSIFTTGYGGGDMVYLGGINTATQSVQANVLVTSANNTGTGSRKYFQYNAAATLPTGSATYNEIGAGVWSNTSAITSIQLGTSAGNIDAGFWALYGSVN